MRPVLGAESAAHLTSFVEVWLLLASRPLALLGDNIYHAWQHMFCAESPCHLPFCIEAWPCAALLAFTSGVADVHHPRKLVDATEKRLGLS